MEKSTVKAFQKHSQQDFTALRSEFRSITHRKMVKAGSCIAAVENEDKNRYSNIFPYDEHRVKLGGSDYINASMARFDEIDRSYIVTIAPLHPDFYGPDTCGDFWQMIWEQDVPLIIMLARVERGFSGASRYWPKEVGETATYSEFEVELIEDNCHDIVRTRKLRIVHSDTSRVVTHLQFREWPNYEVPGSYHSICDFVRHVEKTYQSLLEKSADHENKEAEASSPPKALESPIVVHCSGGVGRSGTFVSIHALYLKYIKAGTSLAKSPEDFLSLYSIPDTVRFLRTVRHPWMVETGKQFELIYSSLAYLVLKTKF